MSKIFYLKKIIKFFYYNILNIIFFLRSLKNSIKLIVNNKIDNFYLPNLSINNVIIVDPLKIKYKNAIPLKFRKKSKPLILNFNWDKKNQPLDDFENKHHTYVSCRELFLEGVEVEKCKEYFFFKKKIIELGKWKNCSNNEDIKFYFKKLFKLYESIKKNGLKRNVDDNLEFMVDRNENLVKINSGNHRFSISRILKLKSIPIEIKIIHSKCLDNLNKQNLSTKKLNYFLKRIETKYK